MAKNYLKYLDNSKLNKNLLISLFILVIVIIVTIILMMIYFPKSCDNLQCFSESMADCEHASLVRVDSKASWYSEIKRGLDDNSCLVKVKLLKMNQGDIDVEYLEGLEMTCAVKKAETLFPEENMESCTGILKEELQGIIIEKMHNYIIKNINDIKESFTL
jgi:hypothetical protein